MPGLQLERYYGYNITHKKECDEKHYTRYGMLLTANELRTL